jgi:Sulfotransferase family
MMSKPLKKRLVNAYRALQGIEPPRTTGREVPPISEVEIAEAKTFFPLEKFFIFGHARSGTTMLTRLIRLHPEVHCNYQAHFFTRLPLLESLVSSADIGDWLSRNSNRWNRGRDLSPVVLRAVADYILERDARSVGKRIVGDKSPSSLLDGEAVRLMHKVYPDAHLIYIVRDGRDAAISHRFQAFIDFPHQLSKEELQIRSDFIRDPEVFLSGERSIFTNRALRQAAAGWDRNVSETDQLGKELYRQCYISLRYEDLVEDPWDQIQRLWGFLEASPADHDLENALNEEMKQNPDADWQQQKAKEIAQPLHKGRRGSWRKMLTPTDRKTFEDVAGQTLQAWGYPLEKA